jgi:hypothetical protein
MSGIKQQNPSFCFIAADNGVAPKRQVKGALNNQFRARPCRDGLLEAMKALVIKKNFQIHCAPATVKNGPGQGNSKSCRNEGAPPHAPAKLYLSTYRTLMLDGTLERSGQCLGVELSRCAWQLCLLKFSQIEIRSNCRLDSLLSLF